MRYLLAESSAAMLRALAAKRGGVSFDDRRVDRAAPARPRPFACRIDLEAQGGPRLECFLPPLCAQAIRWGDDPLAPSTTLGTVTDPWVDVGAWSDSLRVWLAIAPPVDTGQTATSYAGGWAVVLSATAPTSLSGRPARAHLVAAMETATGGDKRFVQYHLGSMLLAGDGTVVLDTDETPGNPPGESVNRYQAMPSSPDPSAPVQLRQFHDVADLLAVQGVGDTGSAPSAEDLHVLFRQHTSGTSPVRPKLVYVEAAAGPFWVRGGNVSTNYATSIKIGTPAGGYVTITVSP